jgi:protein-S-isoprenylcysteine O-methyltransferase Ste14
MKTNMITLALFLVALVWLGLLARDVEWTAVKIAGGVLAGLAVIGLVAARLQLGASFSVKAKARKLVTTGVYAKIRNPIYVFGELFILGLSIASGGGVADADADRARAEGRAGTARGVWRGV